MLLSDSWSETAVRALFTTALTGLISVAALCGIALVGKHMQWFAWLTVGVSLATYAWLLQLIWRDTDISEFGFQVTISLSILTTACAVASLLLLLVQHNMRVLLYVTLGLITLGVFSIIAIIFEKFPENDAYWRAMGVVWIFAALGTVVLPVISLLRRNQNDVGEALQKPESTRLSSGAIRRIESAAQAAGVTPDELVGKLLP